MLVDSHCHLDFPDFQEDFDEVLANAAAAGVGKMLTICTHVTRFEKILSIAKAHDNVFCTVGIHPHEAAHEPEVSPEDLILMAQHPKVVGFGETGLDFFYDHSPRDIQRRQFRSHIEAARHMSLPVIVHTREADEDTLKILNDEMKQGEFSGLIHCFSASAAFAARAVEMGFYISVSGIITFKKADELRETISQVPLSHLLVETDAPYLSPVPKRGKRNEPAFTAHTAAKVAEIKGVSVDEFAKISTDNFHRLFTKVKR